MRARESVRAFFGRVANVLAVMRRDADFTCGDCDHWESCGLPPSKECISRLSQMARDEGRPPVRAPLIPQ